MNIQILTLIVATIGLIIYLATDGKPSSAGLASFFAGLLAFLLRF